MKKKSDLYRLGVWAGNQSKVSQKLLEDPDYAAGVEEGLSLADVNLWVEKPIDRICPKCGKPGEKNGFGANGKQRYVCKPCSVNWTQSNR